MRLEDLEYFLAIAEELNVGRASLRLGISQPALSKGLQRLERELGFQLFQREPKGMVMTQASKSFFERTKLLRSSLTDAIKEASEIHLGSMGVLRVGISTLYIDHPFVPAAVMLRSQRPAVRIQVSMGLNDNLLDSLRLGDLDLIICALSDLPPDDLNHEVLFKDDFRIVARTNHPLTKQSRVTLEDIAKQPWLLPRTKVMARRQIEAKFAEAGLEPPNVAVEVTGSASQMIELVRQSDVITLMGERMLSTAMGVGLAELPVKNLRWHRPVGIITRPSSYQLPLATRFIEILKETIASEIVKVK